FPELEDKDLYTTDVNEPHQLRDGSKVEGWIWRIGKYGNPSPEEQAQMSLDVQWFRARADMERWQEEVEILAQEFRRSIKGFTKMRDVWTSLAQ
ncbi:hypothetical protein R3P38DRAFT_2435965, partial [Favolaschia claudopus]